MALPVPQYSVISSSDGTTGYYDKAGLFPHIERTSGIRKLSDTEIEALHVIECLKKTGMEIKDIKQFMQWCSEGPSTYPKRKDKVRDILSNLVFITLTYTK